MPLPYIKNLKAQEVYQVEPWDFVPSFDLDTRWGKDKKKRLDESVDENLEHCFYSGFLGKVPSMRIGKLNPAEKLVAFPLDIDATLDQSVVMQTIDAIPPGWKPTRVEFTLSEKWRFLWEFESPIFWGLRDPKQLWDEFFNRFMATTKVGGILDSAIDKASFRPTQYFCNHCNWARTGYQPIATPLLRGLMREAYEALEKKQARFGEAHLTNWDKAYEALQKRYPKFKETWTRAQFNLGQLGTTFWSLDSDSPTSAQVKEDGMLSYAMHTDRMFYPWAVLLGAEFVEIDQAERNQFIEDSFVYNDAESKYYKNSQAARRWIALNKSDVSNELAMLGLNRQITQGERLNEIEQWLMKIRNENAVTGMGPFMFNQDRIVSVQGEQWLNTFHNESRAMTPACEASEWGPKGRFPKLSKILETRCSNQKDFDALLTFAKVAYESQISMRRQPKQALIIAGEAQTGKTFFNTGILSWLVGGHADGGKFMTGESKFAGNLFNHPHIAIDDAEMSVDQHSQKKFTEKLKSLVSNPLVRTEEKFKTAGRGEWYGTICITCNLDSGSLTGAMPDLTMSISDKVIIVKFDGEPLEENMEDLIKVMQKELPHFAAWLLKYQPPEWLVTKGRYQMAPYKNPDVLDEFTQMSDHFLLAQHLLKGLRSWFDGPVGKDHVKFIADHQGMFDIFISSGDQFSLREWTQKKFIIKLRSLIKSVEGCRWIEYNLKTAKWTVYRDRLPSH